MDGFAQEYCWTLFPWWHSPKETSSENTVVSYSLIMAARWLLVLVSMGPQASELRVARGLATGAVDFPLASPVQRRMNCNVGPWENVSNGGSLCGTVTDGGSEVRSVGWCTQCNCTNPFTFPSSMVSHVALFLLTGLSSMPCIDTSYSPSSSCNLL